MSEEQDLSLIVGARVSRLQGEYLRSSAPGAIALLASLRHAVGREPGDVPEIWEITVAGLGPARGDEPTPRERACHDAITLYVLHQQSRATAMHVPGAYLGRSVHRLGMSGGVDNSRAVRRRFDAAATASTYIELCHHLRGLVSQLRSAAIPTDYGALARDLLDSQRIGGLAVVRRRWARAYYAEARSAQGENVTNLGPASDVHQDDQASEEEQ